QYNKAYTKYNVWVMTYPVDWKETRLYLDTDGDFPIDLDNLIPTATLNDMLYEDGFKGNMTHRDVLIYKQKIINLQQQIEYYNGTNIDLDIGDTNVVTYRT